MEKNKVLGYAEHIGIYELIDNPLSKKRDGQQKFELKRGEGENYMRFSLASRQLRWLQGEVLTVIDASFTNEKQCKAVKDLIKDKFSAKISWLYEICGTPSDDEEAALGGEEDK